MNQLWRISPSAVSKSLGCEVQYQLDLIEPRGEPTEKQQLGTDLHAVQQDYLNLGTAQDRNTRVGKMALAGLPFMPGPRTGMAEGECSVTIAGIEYVLILDYEGPADLVPDAPKGMPAVIDHKTSSDPDKYGLWGHEALVTDPQAITYAAKALVKFRAPRVFSRWIYYDTSRKSKALASDTVMERGEVQENFGKIVHPAAVRLIVLQNEAPPKDAPIEDRRAWANTLQHNPHVCLKKYGGCKHREEIGGACRLSITESLTACLSGLNEVKTINGSTVGSPSVVTQVENVPPLSADGGGSVDLFAKLQAGIGLTAPAPGGATAGVAPDAAAILAASKKPSARPVGPTLPTPPDPVNAPEKPTSVAIPAKGADLLAHLKGLGVANGASVPSPAPETPAVAIPEIPKAASVPDPTKVTAERSVGAPTVVEKAEARKASAKTPEESKNKLDSIISATQVADRDRIALEAMKSLTGQLALLDPTEIATRAYAIADAMLKARS